MLNGKEAKLAWANGEAVQIECAGGFFELLEHREFLNVFDNPKNKFRLKPETITINGIEIEIPKDIVIDAVTGSVGLVYGDVNKSKQVVAELRKLKCTT